MDAFMKFNGNNILVSLAYYGYSTALNNLSKLHPAMCLVFYKSFRVNLTM